MIKHALSAAFALSIAYPAGAQTLNMMKAIDAPDIDIVTGKKEGGQ